MHPEWYYRYFEAAFAFSRDYAGEVELLGSIKGQTIEEIGAGTGNHVHEMLKQGASRVLAIDLDPQAIPILTSRFAGDQRVEIIQEDGFFRKTGPAATVACFYCLVQHARDPEEADRRLSYLIERCATDSSNTFFEWMDIDLHLAGNLGRPPTRLHASGPDFLDVGSRPTKSGAVISYRGHLDGAAARYDVPLVRLPLERVGNLCAAAGLTLKIIPLSPSRRRCLLHLSKA